MPSTKVKRAIVAFERAVEDRAFKGSYPIYSDGPEEQIQLDAIHMTIEHNYVKARAKLERLLENV